MWEKCVLHTFSTFKSSLSRVCVCSSLDIHDMRNRHWIRFHLHSYFLLMGGYFDLIAFWASVRSSSRSFIVLFWLILMLCRCYFRENMVVWKRKQSAGSWIHFHNKSPIPYLTKSVFASFRYMFLFLCLLFNVTVMCKVSDIDSLEL